MSQDDIARDAESQACSPTGTSEVGLKGMGFLLGGGSLPMIAHSKCDILGAGSDLYLYAAAGWRCPERVVHEIEHDLLEPVCIPWNRECRGWKLNQQVDAQSLCFCTCK
jgi:hypothetical protein